MISNTANINTVIVRRSTSHWHDTKGSYIKISLCYLKRKCQGFNYFQEDLDMVSAKETLSRIVNLYTVPDGVYILKTINETHDWETGYLDDWNYKLIQFGEIL